MTDRPIPWSGGLPWSEPQFSERMLAEHLSQDHGAASRRTADIDAHVAWLHEAVLGGAPSRVLDLGCGPGLYTSRLAALGHSCVGIDFAPAAIAYARRKAVETGADCTYVLEDIGVADFGSGFDLITFLFGDIDTVPPAVAGGVISKAAGALVPGGRLVLEVHTRPAVKRIGTAEPSRTRAASGLFADRPHVVDQRSWWDPVEGLALIRFRIHIDGSPDREHVITTQARGRDGYAPWLASAGFSPPEESAGYGAAIDPDFVVLVAARP